MAVSCEDFFEHFCIVVKTGHRYFVIADMSSIDPMYQYSLEFFVNLFKGRLAKSEKSDDVEHRVSTIVGDVTLAT